jgi:gamma-glutamyl-gamma-aminobutyrate hydrolase PuuD
MNNKRKINVLVNGNLNNRAYLDFLSEAWDVNVLDSKKYQGEKLDLVLFIGGEDVYPQYYQENLGSRTICNQERDKYEKNYLFQNFTEIPKLGICRGAQFLTVFSGGKLFQHVDGHSISGLHPIEMNSLGLTGSVYNITSTHHQMMNPFELSPETYEIIAYSKYHLSNTYLNGNDLENSLPENFVEPEIVYYRNTNSLCVQGHPEMQNCPKETKEMIIKLIKKSLKL